MTRYYSATAQDTTLTSSVTNSSTSIVVAATTGYPTSYPFILALDYNTSAEELVAVTNVSGLTLTVTRAYNGTTAQAHAVGAVVRHVITAQDLTDAQNHYGLTSGVHGVTGSVVGTTDTQTLTNKTLTAPIIAMSINAQTGTTYTLVAGDAANFVTLSNSSAITLTVPLSTFAIGQVISIQQIGAGQITIVAASGVTITSLGATSTSPQTRAQYSAASIVCLGTNTFTVIGDII